MTTKKEIEAYKRFAKEACKVNNIKTNMCNMIVLEAGTTTSDKGVAYSTGTKIIYIDYVCFYDKKTGKTYNCGFDVKYSVMDITE